MTVIGDMFRGMVMLSIFAITHHGCSVAELKSKAVDAHQTGLTDYGAYSRKLTNKKDSWAKR